MLKQFVIVVLFFTSLFYLHTVEAQVRSSASYQLQSDSVNIGGGLASSSNFVQESTVGEVGTGQSDSSSYSLRAGFQQMQEVFISITEAADVVMDDSINGIVGGETNGSTTVTVVSDSAAGYQLTIEASGSPAMQDGANTIADYVPAAADPDVAFTTANNEAHLAYSPFGSDVVTRFQTDGNDCNVGGGASSTACWDGLSTTATVIAESSAPNQPAGTDTTVYFKVGVGSSVVQAPGTYVATTTLTAIAL